MLNACIPSAPSYIARVIPIYFEPMMGSGERLTVAIGAVSENGERIDVLQVIRPDVLECMYGKQAQGIQNLIEIVIEDLRVHLKNSKAFSDWMPPLTGIFKGTERKEAADHWEDIFKHASLLHSSLSKYIQKTENEKIEKWPLKIKHILEKENPDLAKHINTRVKITQKGIPLQIGFYYDRYAANFGFLGGLPSQVSRNMSFIRAKLWELRQIRHGTLLFSPEIIELILRNPYSQEGLTNRQSSRVVDAVEEVKFEATRMDIKVVPVKNAEEAATRILRQVG
ncbi:MAG: hypothetical protein ACYCR5_04640 [Leptospirillum sp.]